MLFFSGEILPIEIKDFGAIKTDPFSSVRLCGGDLVYHFNIRLKVDAHSIAGLGRQRGIFQHLSLHGFDPPLPFKKGLRNFLGGIDDHLPCIPIQN